MGSIRFFFLVNDLLPRMAELVIRIAKTGRRRIFQRADLRMIKSLF